TAAPHSSRLIRTACKSGGAPISACLSKPSSPVHSARCERTSRAFAPRRAPAMAGSWTATSSNAHRLEHHMLPDWVSQPCPKTSVPHREAARARQDQLTKPTGALGRLEQLAIDLAALQHADRPHAELAPVIVFAGD